MRKGMRNLCNDDGSTSTLNQHDNNGTDQSPCTQNDNISKEKRSPTLEEMILQLELEEEMARKAKLNETIGMRSGRMSCVNSSDILRSARNALNQYPRFSLDGKDAMYRASFRDTDAAAVLAGRRSAACCPNGSFSSSKKSLLGLPQTIAGESVVWCKPGVVARLMGLEEVPVPVTSYRRMRKEKLMSSSPAMIMRRQNLRRRAERHEMERRLAMNNSNVIVNGSSCSKAGTETGTGQQYAIKPVVEYAEGDGGWPTRRFR